MGELIKKTFKSSIIGLIILGVMSIYYLVRVLPFLLLDEKSQINLIGGLLYLFSLFFVLSLSLLLSIFITTFVFSKKQFPSKITSALIGIGASVFSFIIIYGIIIPIILSLFNLFDNNGFFEAYSYYGAGFLGLIVTGITGLILGLKSCPTKKSSSKNTKKHYWIRGLILGFIFSLIVFIISAVQCISEGNDCRFVQSIFLLNIFKTIVGNASPLIVLFLYIILGG